MTKKERDEQILTPDQFIKERIAKIKSEPHNLEDDIKKTKFAVSEANVKEKYKNKIYKWLDGLKQESATNEIILWRIGYNKVFTYSIAIFYVFNDNLKKIAFRTVSKKTYEEMLEGLEEKVNEKENQKVLKDD